MSNSLAVLLLLPVFCQWLTALSRKSWWYILGIVVIKKCLLYYSFNYSYFGQSLLASLLMGYFKDRYAVSRFYHRAF